MIALRKICKIYRRESLVNVKALSDIDIKIGKGEFVVIKGASGSGKTTLMNIIGFLDKPTGGEYRLNGNDVTRLSDRDISVMRGEKIGFVFQSFNLIKTKSSIENVMLPMLYSKEFPLDFRKLSIRKLEEVGLSHRLKHRPSELSGGEQQRVAIARALVNDPGIILADEPTGNLDSRTGIEIMSIFKSLNEAGKTIIIVTHEDFITSYAKRVITLRDGRLLSDTARDQ